MSDWRRCPFAIALAMALLLLAWPCAAQTTPAPRCGTGVHEAEAEGAVLFPEDQIFCPVLADPKEARSFVSLLRGTFRSLDDPSGEGHRPGKACSSTSSAAFSRSSPSASHRTI